MRYLLLVIILFSSAPVFAQPIPSVGDISDSAPIDTHPLFSTDATWAGSMVIAIAGLFVAAMVIGPMIDTAREDDLPASPDHSGHHAHHH
jgi:hypothetical protein